MTHRIFHDRRHPGHLGAEHVQAFLSALATEQRVAASTQNQALAALLFLYERVVKRAATEAGLTKRVTGHSDVRTTMIYTHVAESPRVGRPQSG